MADVKVEVVKTMTIVLADKEVVQLKNILEAVDLDDIDGDAESLLDYLMTEVKKATK